MSREKVVFQAESAETVTENIEEQISETARENSQTENGVFVKGMALPFGETSRNGVQYEKESVKEKADDLVGRPILFNHKQDYGTGHILNIEVTDEGMFYEGDINPNAEMPNGVSVAEAVERGDIRSPSIQAFIEQTGEEAEKSAVIDDMQTEKVRVADFIEISMVTVPGFPQASAMPEHLQRQGVKPITEALGIDRTKIEQADYAYETGDWVSWEFGSGSSQGQITDRENEPGESLSASGNEREATEQEPVYKMDEWDEEQEELTNDVVKSQDELTEIDDPRESEEQEENIAKEQYEFAPVPTHVLYEDEEDAMQRARNLGLDDTHEHEMSGQIYYMAGDNHDEWLEAIERENPTDREDTRSEPFAGYDDFDDCIQQNSDKADPEAYCSVIKRKTEQAQQLSEAVEDVDTTPTDEIANIASEVLEKIDDSEYDNDGCATRTGLERANQLENQEDLSPDTINRMVSFFARHDGNQEVDDDADNKWEDCGFVAWQLWGGDAGREWAERKQEELEDAREEGLNDISEDDNSMTEQEEDNTEQEEVKSEEFEQVPADDMYELVAGMHPQVEANDVSELLGEFDYDFNVNALVDFVAKVVDEETNTVMDKMADMAEGEMPDEDEPEEEGDYGDDDEDDMEEENAEEENEDNPEDKGKEELEEQVKEQSDKIDQLEERLETILDEDEGSSKQESPSGEGEESILNRRPTFKGLTDN